MKQFWINLPVKDVSKSREFFTGIGFKFSDGQGNSPHSAPLLLGEKGVIVMLFDEPTFKGFIGNGPISTNATEVLLSIDAQSKEEVDELVKKVIGAGGTSTHRPSEMKGPMYGCVFTDIDGHRWNVLYIK
jgi:predicted lactoylglutathione lyase